MSGSASSLSRMALYSFAKEAAWDAAARSSSSVEASWMSCSRALFSNCGMARRKMSVQAFRPGVCANAMEPTAKITNQSVSRTVGGAASLGGSPKPQAYLIWFGQRELVVEGAGLVRSRGDRGRDLGQHEPLGPLPLHLWRRHRSSRPSLPTPSRSRGSLNASVLLSALNPNETPVLPQASDDGGARRAAATGMADGVHGRVAVATSSRRHRCPRGAA